MYDEIPNIVLTKLRSVWFTKNVRNVAKWKACYNKIFENPKLFQIDSLYPILFKRNDIGIFIHSYRWNDL